YQLCGDLESIRDCHQSHSWQSLYAGLLREAELHHLEAAENGNDYSAYWMALLLAIRQSEHARELLQQLPVGDSRWTLQTAAEAWFYLEEYDKAEELARAAWDLREEEVDSVEQTLWEAVTLGLALVHLGRGDEAAEYLEFAISRGTGWCYNLVPMFALAGRIESHYREASKKKGIRDRDDQLSKADLVYKQYCKSDPEDRFQIPAAEAHLAMARVSNLRGERNEAVRRAER